MLKHYCISCLKEIFPTQDDILLCADCGGTAEEPFGLPTFVDASPLELVGAGTLLDTPPSTPELSPQVSIPDLDQPLQVSDGSAGDSAPDSNPSDEEEAWHPGTQLLDTYVVKGLLGVGGMGKVYRVHHKSWNIDLALKSPRPEFFQTQAHKDLFISEAETWINLGLHPHIVSCYYVRTIEDIPRLFAECVEGGSLAGWIARRRIQSLEQILDIAIQFAWGLAYAHEQGLVHRDVKPANVLMLPEGVAKVTDFGLAKAKKGLTPAYCSPEQADAQFDDQIQLTPASDLWGWALSLLEMIAGSTYWADPANPRFAWGVLAPQALQRYLDGKVENPMLAEIPAGLAELLGQCFWREPAGRPKNMLEVAGRLQEIYKQETGHPYPRQAPKAAELRADSLNNKALSLLDLGRQNEALATWKEALEIEPLHLEATFNICLYVWRVGMCTGALVSTKMEAVLVLKPENWRGYYLSGLVKLEIGDEEAAEELFAEALKRLPGQPDVERARLLKDEITLEHGEKIFTDEREGITHIVVHPEAQLAFAVTGDSKLRIWDLNTGQPVKDLEVSDVENPAEENYGYLRLRPVKGSPRILVSGYPDASFRLWDWENGHCLQSFKGHEESVLDVAVSPNGRLVVSAGEDHTIRVWEVHSGACLKVLKKHEDAVYCVAFTPDGKHIISAGSGVDIFIWDYTKGSTRRLSGVPYETVQSMALSPDGDRLLTGSHEENAVLWDLKRGAMLYPLMITGHDRSYVWSVAVTPDGSKALVGDCLGRLEVWDLKRLVLLRRLRGHKEGIYSISFSPDSRYAFSAAADGVLRWDLAQVERRPAEWAVSIPSSAVEEIKIAQKARGILKQAEKALQESRYEAFQEAMKEFRGIAGYEWNAQGYELWQQAGTRAGIRSRLAGFRKVRTLEQLARGPLKISADGTQALVGDQSKLRLLDLRDGTTVHSFATSLRNNVETIDLYKSSGVSAHKDGKIQVWDLESGASLKVWHGSEACVYWVKFIQDGQAVLAASEDGIIRLWDLENKWGGKALFNNYGADFSVTSLHPDQRTAVMLENDGRLSLADLTTGGLLHSMRLKRGRLGQAQCTPDGKKVIYNGETYGSESLGVWDLINDKNAESWYQARKLVISPDGKFLATSSTDFDPENELASNYMLKVFPLGRVLIGAEEEEDNDAGEVIDPGADGTETDETGESNDMDETTFEMGHTPIEPVSFSLDGRFLFAVNGKDLQAWELLWEYTFPPPQDWEETARPYLEIFLNLHRPLAADGISRRGKPEWSEADFQLFLIELGYRGYGWLRPEGVRKKLDELATEKGRNV